MILVKYWSRKKFRLELTVANVAISSQLHPAFLVRSDLIPFAPGYGAAVFRPRIQLDWR